MTALPVALVLDLVDLTGAALVKGSMSVAPSMQIPDPGDFGTVTMAPRSYAFRAGGFPKALGYSTDSIGPQPDGWTWNLTPSSDLPGNVAAASYYIPAGPASVTMTDASPAVFTWTPTASLTVLYNGCGVQLAGSFPGFETGQTYYVVDVDGESLSLAATQGGSAIASTSTGSGTLTVVQYNLSALASTPAGQPGQQYLPLPSGAPSAGQVPVATGSDEASAWGTVATDAYVTAAVAAETSRAETAEGVNATAISAETTRAETAEAFILLRPSGDATGATDTASIAAALAVVTGTTEAVRLAQGNWYISSRIAAQSNSQSVTGAGRHCTRINTGSAWNDTDMLDSGGYQYVTFEGFSLVGPSGSVGGATQLNGLKKQPGARFTARDIYFSNLNGWAFYTTGTGNDAAMTLDNLDAQNCAGGYYLLGNHSGQSAVTMLGCSAQSIGTATGPAAALQMFQVTDYYDLTSYGPMSPTVISGACASCTFLGIDTAPPSNTQPVILIEDGANGSPTDIVIDDGIIQDGSIGVRITGGASRITLGSGLQVSYNQTHGVSVEGTGTAIKVGAHMFHNGASGSGANYDLNWSGSATGSVRGAWFDTAIGSGASTVTASVSLSSSAAAAVPFRDCQFPQAGVTGTRFAGTAPTALYSAYPPVPGQFLCPPTSYAPGAQTTFTTTSGTFAAVSSANVNTGSFTAPPSGSVIVTVTLVEEMSAASIAYAFGLCAHGTTTPMVGNSVITKDSAASEPTARAFTFPVTGLTPGATYNFDLMFAAASSDTLTVLAIAQTGTSPTLSNAGAGAPVTMAVQAV